jgi:hypothetical protein
LARDPGIDYPVLVAQGKLRCAGFAGVPDNGAMLLARLRDLARRGILPPLAADTAPDMPGGRDEP